MVSLAAWKFFLPSPCRPDWLRQHHLFVLCFTPNPLVNEGVCMLSSGLIWAQLGSCGLLWAHLGSSGLIWAHLSSSELIWAHLGPLGSSALSWAHLCSSGLLEARLGSPGLIRSTSPASRSSTSQQPISENQGYYHLLWMSSGKLPFTPAHSTHGRHVWIPETGGCS